VARNLQTNGTALSERADLGIIHTTTSSFTPASNRRRFLLLMERLLYG
jgi:hypothetical protein